MISRVAFITLRAKGEARSVCKRAPGGSVGAPPRRPALLAAGAMRRASMLWREGDIKVVRLFADVLDEKAQSSAQLRSQVQLATFSHQRDPLALKLLR